MRAFLLVGVLGGFTTFATFSLLTASGTWQAAIVYVLLTAVACVGAVLLGYRFRDRAVFPIRHDGVWMPTNPAPALAFETLEADNVWLRLDATARPVSVAAPTRSTSPGSSS